MPFEPVVSGEVVSPSIRERERKKINQSDHSRRNKSNEIPEKIIMKMRGQGGMK